MWVYDVEKVQHVRVVVVAVCCTYSKYNTSYKCFHYIFIVVVAGVIVC